MRGRNPAWRSSSADSVSVDGVWCIACGAALAQQPAPCPVCGSTIRHIKASAQSRLRPISESLEMRGRHAGERSWFVRSFIRAGVWQRARGVFATHRRHIDRDRDVYEESVVAEDGTTLYQCREPLSEHKGRGSARNSPQ